MDVMGEMGQKIIIGIGTTAGLSVVWWAKRKVADPILDFMVHFAPLLADVAAIKSEVLPNGGNSMRDEIKSIKTSVSNVDARTRNLEVRQMGLVATLSRPYFETDAQFNWEVINRETEKMFGFSSAALEKKRWVAKVHEDDRQRVQEEVQDAIETGRGVTATFRIVTEDAIFSVHLEASPQVVAGHVVGWSGCLTRA
jgi:PAS domain S-box-containing protein